MIVAFNYDKTDYLLFILHLLYSIGIEDYQPYLYIEFKATNFFVD